MQTIKKVMCFEAYLLIQQLVAGRKSLQWLGKSIELTRELKMPSIESNEKQKLFTVFLLKAYMRVYIYAMVLIFEESC